MSEPVKKIVRFHFLDGLRGYAILITIFAHTVTSNLVKFFVHLKVPYVPQFLPGLTASGLDLFFVLSGMVIIRPYIRKQRKFKAYEYFSRRAKRIYPPYFFAFIFATLVVLFSNRYPTWYNLDGMQMHFSWPETFKEAGVINFSGIYYNLAWWSLTVEIVFYLLVPLIISLFLRWNKLTIIKVYVIILITIAVFFQLHFLFDKYLPSIYSINKYILNIGKFLDYPICFLMGVFLAARDFEVRDAYVFIIAGSLFVISFVFNIPFLEPHYWFMVQSGYALIYSGVIILAFNISKVNNFWSHPFMIWVGERSYSLYLVHFSVFYLVDNIISHFLSGRNAFYAILSRGIGIPLAMLAAMLLFQLVERRFAHGLTTSNIIWPWHLNRLKLHEEPKKERPA